MAHPELLRLSAPTKEAHDLGDILQFLKEWRIRHQPKEEEYHSRVWYRGHANHSWRLLPKLYRDDEAGEALTHIYRSGEFGRQALEREMLEEFRNSAAPFIDAADPVAVLFTAQHFGMPTRLLDWTTNPLVAAYFAVTAELPTTGEIIVMDASKCVEKDFDYAEEATKKEGEQTTPESIVGQFVMGVRHLHALHCINESFWKPGPLPKVIIPIRPDAAVGRIGQQSSRFTLHRHDALPATNPTMDGIKIPADAKEAIRADLHRLNINHHSIYHDLDHLARGIREARKWGSSPITH